MTMPLDQRPDFDGRPSFDDSWVGYSVMIVAILVVGLAMWLGWPALSRWDDRSRATLIVPFVMNAALAQDVPQAVRMVNYHPTFHRRGDIDMPAAARYGIAHVDQDTGHIRVSWGPLSPDVCEAVQAVVKDKSAETASVHISVKGGPSWSQTADFLRYDCRHAPMPLVLVFEPQRARVPE
jgi:hypothetical protein